MEKREFIKRLGLFSAATATVGLTEACKQSTSNSGAKKLGSGTTAGELLENIPASQMTMRTNPTTGDKVSLLGYGCMRLPQIKQGENKGKLDQEQINKLVDYAIEHGVNYFDTSPVYCEGKSEEAMGIALSRHPRDKYFIATKLSNFSPDTWSREKSLEMYYNSFKYLKVDVIDYMLLHGIGMGGFKNYNGRYVDNGILDFLLEERQKGKIRNLGFSYHGDIEVFDYLLSKHDEYKWDFVQIQLNYVDWKHAKATNKRNTDSEYLYAELEKRGIPAVIMEPLLGGRLANVNNHLKEMFFQRKPEASVAQWAFRFSGHFPGILTSLSGMTYLEHLQDNLLTFSPLEYLSDEELEFLEKVAQEYISFKTIPCNDCKYCMPCPYGLDIPAILLHYNKCINEGMIPGAVSESNYETLRRKYLISYGRAVPAERNAEHCAGCHKCEIHCPQNIKIADQIRRIDAFIEEIKRKS